MAIDFNVDNDNCWLNLRAVGQDEKLNNINSPPFSISSDEQSQTTLGLEETTSTTTDDPEESTTSPATASTTSGASTTTGASTSTTETTGQASATDSPNDSQGEQEEGSADAGLSTGAKAGIGVGVSLGVLGLAALVGAFLIVRRRNEKRTAQELEGTSAVEHKPVQPYVPPQELPGHRYVAPELDGRRVER